MACHAKGLDEEHKQGETVVDIKRGWRVVHLSLSEKPDQEFVETIQLAVGR